MRGLMMNVPLTTTSIMQHADKNHPRSEIVSVTSTADRHRYTFAEAFRRTRQLANALTQEGIGTGDRIATLAWNDYRHVELYYAVSGIGAVIHTINPRLFPEQISYIINHAKDRLIFVDPLILPLLEGLKDQIRGVEAFIVLAEDVPESTLRNLKSYENFIGDYPEDFEWPELDEQTASSMCYTSGTTGQPKGVVYTHRSTVLHSLVAIQPDQFNFSVTDSIMPVVPMFHVNGWGIPYAAPVVGAKLVLPGPKAGDPEVLCALMEDEQVTFSAGVPTVWLALLHYLEEKGKTPTSLERVVIGGSACPLSIITTLREQHNVTVHHAWGMTETSPLGAFNSLKPGMASLPDDELNAIRLKQGRAIYGLDMKIVDEDDNELPRDGKAFGLLKVRGPWVCSDYFQGKDDRDYHDQEGWFATGDVATLDEEGYMQITDRQKDIIKSGGEWISSIDLENAVMNHPDVAEAAVIGIPHPKWMERPLLIVVTKDNTSLDKKDLLKWLAGKVTKWWLPDDVIFTDTIPHTATGKILKSELRRQFVEGKE